MVEGLSSPTEDVNSMRACILDDDTSSNHALLLTLSNLCAVVLAQHETLFRALKASVARERQLLCKVGDHRDGTLCPRCIDAIRSML